MAPSSIHPQRYVAGVWGGNGLFIAGLNWYVFGVESEEAIALCAAIADTMNQCSENISPKLLSHLHHLLKVRVTAAASWWRRILWGQVS